MAEAQNGDTVRVHYTGTLEDGTVFDSSINREPLEFTLGQKGIIEGFQEIVKGMSPGDTKTDSIPPEKAYGDYMNEMVLEVQKEQLPEDLNPEEGSQLQLALSDGQVIPVRVTEVKPDSITIDANHQLAGKTLEFEINLIEVNP